MTFHSKGGSFSQSTASNQAAQSRRGGSGVIGARRDAPRDVKRAGDSRRPARATNLTSLKSLQAIQGKRGSTARGTSGVISARVDGPRVVDRNPGAAPQAGVPSVAAGAQVVPQSFPGGTQTSGGPSVLPGKIPPITEEQRQKMGEPGNRPPKGYVPGSWNHVYQRWEGDTRHEDFPPMMGGGRAGDVLDELPQLTEPRRQAPFDMAERPKGPGVMGSRDAGVGDGLDLTPTTGTFNDESLYQGDVDPYQGGTMEGAQEEGERIFQARQRAREMNQRSARIQAEQATLTWDKLQDREKQRRAEQVPYPPGYDHRTPQEQSEDIVAMGQAAKDRADEPVYTSQDRAHVDRHRNSIKDIQDIIADPTVSSQEKAKLYGQWQDHLNAIKSLGETANERLRRTGGEAAKAQRSADPNNKSQRQYAEQIKAIDDELQRLLVLEQERPLTDEEEAYRQEFRPRRKELVEQKREAWDYFEKAKFGSDRLISQEDRLAGRREAADYRKEGFNYKYDEKTGGMDTSGHTYRLDAQRMKNERTRDKIWNKQMDRRDDVAADKERRLASDEKDRWGRRRGNESKGDYKRRLAAGPPWLQETADDTSDETAAAPPGPQINYGGTPIVVGKDLGGYAPGTFTEGQAYLIPSTDGSGGEPPGPYATDQERLDYMEDRDRRTMIFKDGYFQPRPKRPVEQLTIQERNYELSKQRLERSLRNDAYDQGRDEIKDQRYAVSAAQKAESHEQSRVRYNDFVSKNRVFANMADETEWIHQDAEMAEFEPVFAALAAETARLLIEYSRADAKHRQNETGPNLAAMERWGFQHKAAEEQLQKVKERLTVVAVQRAGLKKKISAKAGEADNPLEDAINHPNSFGSGGAAVTTAPDNINQEPLVARGGPDGRTWTEDELESDAAEMNMSVEDLKALLWPEG